MRDVALGLRVIGNPTLVRRAPRRSPIASAVRPRVVGMAVVGYTAGMCRNIRTLFNFEPPVSEDEVRAAALQFVRKLSGFTRPSLANEPAFERAVDDVADVARTLLANLVTSAAPNNRERWAARAKGRSARRFAPPA